MDPIWANNQTISCENQLVDSQKHYDLVDMFTDFQKALAIGRENTRCWKYLTHILKQFPTLARRWFLQQAPQKVHFSSFPAAMTAF